MEFQNASNIQYGSFPVVGIWKGSNLIWANNNFWTGLGTDNNWTTDANWSKLTKPTPNSFLEFAGTIRLNPFNDFTIDTPFNTIKFSTNAGSFQLSGNRIVIGSGGFLNSSPNAQIINNDVKLSAGTNIINAGAGDITFNGLLSGIGSVSKTGTGLVKLSAVKTIFTGSLNVSGGTLQIDNTIDLTLPVPMVYNLNGSGSRLNLNTINRMFFVSKSVNFDSSGNQTFNITGNILTNNSTFTTSTGSKNYLSGGAVAGANYLNGQYTTITYNIADGVDDVDLEVSAYMYNHAPLKTGAGKMSVITPFNIGISGPLTISAGTFDVGGSCSIPSNFSNGTNTIVNNGTFSYSSSVNSNCSNFSINGTGNLIKSGTSSLTLSSARCTYAGSTSIIGGSVITTRDTATATFTPTTLTVNFTSPPNIGDAFKFFAGTTVQTYASVTLIGAPGRAASYISTTSTLSTIS